jgi:hypothetical protein
MSNGRPDGTKDYSFKISVRSVFSVNSVLNPQLFKIQRIQNSCPPERCAARPLVLARRRNFVFFQRGPDFFQLTV